MDSHRFLTHLPDLYLDWGKLTIRPRSDRFGQVLGRVRGMTTANVLQLLNWAVACLEPGEAYAEVGCFHGATLVGALLGHPACPAYAADNFSEFDPHGLNRRLLAENLAAFGLQVSTLM